MNEDFVIEWLGEYFEKPNLNEKLLKPVLHFSLLWNLFEHNYFTDEKRLDPKSLLELCADSFENVEDEKLDYIFDYFKKRYFLNNTLDNKFLTLKLSELSKDRNPSNFEFCQTTLKSDNSLKVEKLKTVFLIIHRFRNNLFHGRKNPETLNIYEQPFKEINKFLIHFIEKNQK